MAVLHHKKSGRTVTVPDDAAEYYLGLGWERPGSTSTSTTGLDEVPDSDWKNADIQAYAELHGIDLGEAVKKADMLAIIAADRD